MFKRHSESVVDGRRIYATQRSFGADAPQDDARTVVIEGAGIAGQVLDRELAQRGIPSRLVERAVFPREKVCGGVLQWDSWLYLRENFGLDEEPRTIETISHFWRGKPLSTHRLPQPMVYVPRIELDEALFKKHVEAEAESGLLQVNAKGAKSGGSWLGFQAEHAPVAGLQMHYGRGICAGIAPTLGKSAHLAFIVKREKFKQPEDLKRFLSEELNIRVLGALKGTGRIRYGYSAEALAVGDAKMSTFPFLGLGMKHAILSARLLAEKISAGEPSRYAREHRRRFFKYRMVSDCVGRLYDSPFQGLLKPLLRREKMFLSLYRWLHL